MRPVLYKEKFPENDSMLGYICGLIASDGCLHKNSNVIAFGQVIDEIETVAFFKNSLIQNTEDCKTRIIDTKESNRYSEKPMAMVSLSLPKLYQYCLGMGITPNKSLTLDVKLDDKSDEFKWYFLRGVIDGDGCVYIYKTYGNSGLQICSSSKQFLETLQKIFGGNLALGTKKSETKNENWILYFRGLLGQALCRYLPMDDFCMKRKTEKLAEFKNLTSNYKKHYTLLKGTIWNDPKYTQYKSYRQLYDEMNGSCPVSFRQVQHRIFDYGWTIEKALTLPPDTLANRGKHSTKRNFNVKAQWLKEIEPSDTLLELGLWGELCN